MPEMHILKVQILKTNPNIFATLSVNSYLFRDMELKEFIAMGDYKILNKIRVRNYVSILVMLTQIDQNLYDEVKLKLYQIQPLIKYLSLEYSKLYQRLDKNQPINNYETEEEEKEKSEKEEEVDQNNQEDEDKNEDKEESEENQEIEEKDET